MFWTAQSTIEETFNAYNDMTFGRKQTPEPVVEKEQVRRGSATETSRPEKKPAKVAKDGREARGTERVRKGLSFSVGGK